MRVRDPSACSAACRIAGPKVVKDLVSEDIRSGPSEPERDAD
jgi:hypothetical protein